MKAKHDRLPTGPLVLVSRSGFTKEARRVAASYGIETLALEDVSEAEVDRIFGDTSSLWWKAFSLTVTKVVIDVPADVDLPAESVAVFRDNLIHAEDGSELGAVHELVEVVMKLERVVRQFGAEGKEEHRSFTLEWGAPQNEEGQGLYLATGPPRPPPIARSNVTGTRARPSWLLSRHAGPEPHAPL